MPSLLLHVLVALVCVVSSGAVLLRRHQRGVFCGSQLAEALSLACNSEYFVPRYARAARHEGFLRSDAAPRRQHRGVVDECCHKPCSMQELRAYCAN